MEEKRVHFWTYILKFNFETLESFRSTWCYKGSWINSTNSWSGLYELWNHAFDTAKKYITTKSTHINIVLPLIHQFILYQICDNQIDQGLLHQCVLILWLLPLFWQDFQFFSCSIIFQQESQQLQPRQQFWQY